jgi:hypothetical protein
MENLSTFRNFIDRGFRGRVECSALLLGLTIVLASCGGASPGAGGLAAAPTASMSASPTPIAAGQNAILTFSSTNATSGTINPGANQVGVNGTFSVSPVQTTIYTFTVTGPGGSTTAPATVTVAAAPSVAISASPMSVNTGGSTNLMVAANNASSVVVTDNLQDPPITLSATGGTVSVMPRVTAVYTATATGVNADIATNTVMVTVTATSPTITFSATPVALVAGQSTTLNWATTNATSAELTSSDGTINEGVPIPTGSTTVTPSANTTYTITAQGNGQQTTATATVTVNSVTSFDGMNAAQAGQTGTTEDDIDPNGAVGTKQFMEYVNTSFQAYDKVTNLPVWSVPQSIGTPWETGFFSNIPECADPQIQLDAVIIFDRLATPPRWVIAAKATNGTEYPFCIAVSNTDDLTSPTFTWYAYFFDLKPFLTNQTTGTVYLPDWPKLGTWWDAYYAGIDMVNNASGVQTENGVLACAFDRTDMLNGVAKKLLNPMQCSQVQGPVAGGYLAHSLVPADVDGTTPPPTGRDEFMVSIQNPPLDGSSTTSSTINLWDFHVDWTTPANSSFKLVSSSPVTMYTPGCYTAALPSQTICVPEPGLPLPIGGLKVDSVGDRLMPRFAYRNFGTYESFLISHTVQTNLGVSQEAQQTGIRWYELRGSGTPTIFQQGTITPDSTLFRFLPSLAQDKNGNAAVGYSVSNPLTDPGINLSFWNLNDGSQPSELTLLSGPGEEIPFNPNNPTPGAIVNNGQWGSYASITVDPTHDCTFWYVNEYWPTTNLAGVPASWSTNISNFQIPGCE